MIQRVDWGINALLVGVDVCLSLPGWFRRGSCISTRPVSLEGFVSGSGWNDTADLCFEDGFFIPHSQ